MPAATEEDSALASSDDDGAPDTVRKRDAGVFIGGGGGASAPSASPPSPSSGILAGIPALSIFATARNRPVRCTGAELKPPLLNASDRVDALAGAASAAPTGADSARLREGLRLACAEFARVSTDGSSLIERFSGTCVRTVDDGGGTAPPTAEEATRKRPTGLAAAAAALTLALALALAPPPPPPPSARGVVSRESLPPSEPSEPTLDGDPPSPFACCPPECGAVVTAAGVSPLFFAGELTGRKTFFARGGTAIWSAIMNDDLLRDSRAPAGDGTGNCTFKFIR